MSGRAKSNRRRKTRKTKSRCRKRLNDKIKINMKEYEHGLFKTRKQAIAVSYSQTLKNYPRCKKSFTRSRRGGGDANTFHPNDTSAAKQVAELWMNTRGDIKPISYGERNDYLLYLKKDTNASYRKNEGHENHYHIWNNEQGGYSIHNKGDVPPLFE